MSTPAEDMFGVRAAKNRKKGGGSRKRDPRAGSSAANRPEGVSREVFLLTGGTTPASMTPAIPVAALANKPVQRRAWARKAFANSARKDALLFQHWARVGDPEGDSPFAKFDRPIRMVSYTDAEYKAVIAKLVPLGPTKELEPTAHASPPAGGARSTTEHPLAPVPKSATARAATNALPLLTPSGGPASLSRGTGAVQIVPASSPNPTPATEAAAAAARAVSAAAAASATASASAGIATGHQVRGVKGESPSNDQSASMSQSPASSPSPSGSPSPPASASPSLSASPPTRSPLSSPSPSPSSLSAGNPHVTRRENSTRAQHAQAMASNVAVSAADASQGDRSGSGGEAPSPTPVQKKAVHFVPPQKLWTRAETDALFSLCCQFELRFPVIRDRWPEKLADRSIDELKDRYYAVAKAVIEHRTKNDKGAVGKLPLALQKHCQAISMNPFDYEYECIRKNQLERQYRRSKAELREEEETVRNARRIEAAQKRSKKERERVAKLLTPAGDVKMTAADGTRVVDSRVAAASVASAAPQKIFPHRKINNGAYPRSSMIYTPVTQSTRIAKRVDQVLEELNVGTRPTPTSYVVDTFDLLRMDVMSYLELHRTVMRKEEETHSLRIRLAKLRGEAAPPPPPGVSLSHRKRKADDAADTGLPVPLFSS